LDTPSYTTTLFIQFLRENYKIVPQNYAGTSG